MSPQCPQPSFGLIRLTIQEQMRFENFGDGHLGSHLRYWNRTILALLYFYVPPMPSIKFQLNPHYGLKIFKMANQGSHLRYWNKTNFAIKISMSPECFPPSLGWIWLIVLRFNNTSTLVGHFVSPPREREKKSRRDSRGNEREREERGKWKKVKEQKK